MKPSDFSRWRSATRLTFSERTLAPVVETRENHAKLLARSQRSLARLQQLQARSHQLLAASRKLLHQPVKGALREPAGSAGNPCAATAGSGPARRETGRREWDGRPDALQCSAWHWIEDGDGLRPVLWRGEDWPNPPSRDTWQDGYATLAPGDLSPARYHGPLTLPVRNVPSRRGSADQGG